MSARGRSVGEGEGLGEKIANEAAGAQARHAFYPAPEALYLDTEELEGALSAMVAVEVGSLITAAAPREGWAPPIQIKAQPRIKPGGTELTGEHPTPPRTTGAGGLKEVQHRARGGLAGVQVGNQVAHLPHPS